jgi:hypothetical protein
MSDERWVEARDAFRLCSRALRCERSTTHMSCIAARRCAAGLGCRSRTCAAPSCSRPPRASRPWPVEGRTRALAASIVEVVGQEPTNPTLDRRGCASDADSDIDPLIVRSADVGDEAPDVDDADRDPRGRRPRLDRKQRGDRRRWRRTSSQTSRSADRRSWRTCAMTASTWPACRSGRRSPPPHDEVHVRLRGPHRPAARGRGTAGPSAHHARGIDRRAPNPLGTGARGVSALWRRAA